MPCSVVGGLRLIPAHLFKLKLTATGSNNHTTHASLGPRHDDGPVALPVAPSDRPWNYAPPHTKWHAHTHTQNTHAENISCMPCSRCPAFCPENPTHVGLGKASSFAGEPYYGCCREVVLVADVEVVVVAIRRESVSGRGGGGG